MSDSKPDTKENSITLRQVFRYSFWVLKFYFSFAPLSISLVILSALWRYLNRILYAFILGKLIDSILKLEEFDVRFIILETEFKYLIIIALVGFVIGNLGSYSRNAMDRLSYAYLTEKLYKHIHQLGIQKLEDPEFTNKLNRAEAAIHDIPYIVRSIVFLLGQLVAIAVSTAILFSFFPWITIFILVISIPKYFVNKYFLDSMWKLNKEETTNRRIANGLAGVLIAPSELDEVMIMGGFTTLSSRFIAFWERYSRLYLRLLRDWLFSDTAFYIAAISARFIGLLQIIKRYVDGVGTIGDATYQFSILSSYYDDIDQITTEYSDMYGAIQKVSEYIDMFDEQPVRPDGELTLDNLGKTPTVEFQNVSFNYPNSQKLVIKNLNLVINPGDKVAIVGHNGAGKTTLTKLLCRIYVPTSGKILVDGKDLNDVKSTEWYRKIGILFQEFNHYKYLTAAENIYMGKPDSGQDEPRMKEAAHYADADKFIEEFDNQYDQILSENIEGGTRPSSGMWQKIAIARFFYRNPPFVIFDEPTAAIDAEAEYKIFNRIYDFFKGKSVVIISHRFSTVRNADLIIVMDHGEIVEAGSHAELLALDGKYAHAFKLQAEGYAS